MGNKNKLFVAVTAGRWQIPAIRAAKKLGFRVCALDGNPSAEGFKIADDSEVVDFDNKESVLNFIRNQEALIAGSLSFASEAGMETMGLINDFCGLTGLTQHEARLFTDKWAQREIWKKLGFPNPKFLTIEQNQKVDEKLVLSINGLGKQIIIKPRQGSGSRGISVLSSPYTVKMIKGALDKAFSCSRAAGAIIESYIQGTEFAAEGFTCNGQFHRLCLTEKHKVEGSNKTVANKLFTPILNATVKEKIWRVVEDAVASLSLNDTASHTEILLDSSHHVWLVESAGRGGGFMVAEGLLPWAFGIDLATISVKAACNISVSIPKPKNIFATLQFFPSQKGVLKSIEGLNKICDLENIVAGNLVEIGTKFSDEHNDAARLGYILTKGKSQNESLFLADFAMQNIKYIIKPE